MSCWYISASRAGRWGQLWVTHEVGRPRKPFVANSATTSTGMSEPAAARRADRRYRQGEFGPGDPDAGNELPQGTVTSR